MNLARRERRWAVFFTVLLALILQAGWGRGYRWDAPDDSAALAAACFLAAAALWLWASTPSAHLALATETHLRRLGAAGASLPTGDARFGALVQAAFAPPRDGADPVEHNRAALLALGPHLPKIGDDLIPPVRFLGPLQAALDLVGPFRQRLVEPGQQYLPERAKDDAEHDEANDELCQVRDQRGLKLFGS